MTDEELVAALRTLGPSSRLPGQQLFAAAALTGAGLDPDEVGRWATAHGGGPFDAGAVKLRKGQRPEDGRVGRPEAFVLVPDSAL
ncbi:MAG: hypothetical protein J7513_14375 [Solirubrobacteraceae bacterium]|nr:hypothetical protein [Solirubrobacteraceae bacterium]